MCSRHPVNKEAAAEGGAPRTLAEALPNFERAPEFQLKMIKAVYHVVHECPAGRESLWEGHGIPALLKVAEQYDHMPEVLHWSLSTMSSGCVRHTGNKYKAIEAKALAFAGAILEKPNTDMKLLTLGVRFVAILLADDEYPELRNQVRVGLG